MKLVIVFYITVLVKSPSYFNKKNLSWFCKELRKKTTHVCFSLLLKFKIKISVCELRKHSLLKATLNLKSHNLDLCLYDVSSKKHSFLGKSNKQGR